MKSFLVLILLFFTSATLMASNLTNPNSANSFQDKNAFQISQVPLKHNNLALFMEKIEPKEPTKLVQPFPDILLIHGVTYSSFQFDLNYQDYSLARYLANKGMRVWLLDITGYGRSAKPSNGFIVNGDYAASDIETAVSYILKKEHVAKINLLGWSFGTISTARMAAKHPDWINALILYAPIYHGMGLPAPTESYHVFSLEGAAEDFQKETNSKKVDFSIVDQSVFNQYLKQAQEYDGKGSPNGTRADLFQTKSVTLFDPTRLTMPVLIVGGTHDPYIDWQKDLPFIKSVLPNPRSKAIKLEGASHILMLEKPYYRQFQKEVWDFINTTETHS